MTGRNRPGLIAAAATLLATAPMAAIYERWSWLPQCAVVVAAVAATAAGARWLRAPRWVQPLVMLAGLALALTWLFPSGEEIVGLLPGPATLDHFGLLAGEAPAAMREHAIPAPNDDALLFVTALGVGLVAILVDLCAVGLGQPALAGLPMLAIYSVPVAVRSDGVPATSFVIGALGYLWLLGTDNLDRVRQFGRRFTGEGQDVDAWKPSPLAAAGRRLTVIGVVLAVMLPLAVPGMTGMVDRWNSGFGSGGGSGEVNLFAELSGRLNQDTTEDMVRVTTNDPEPFYLRFAVASEITGARFSPPVPGGSPVTHGLAGTRVWPGTGISQRQYTADVEITEAFHMPMAPTYAELARVSGLAPQWLYDPEQQIVFSHRARAAGLTYQFDYVRSELPSEALRQAPPLPEDHPMQQLTQVPEVPEVAELVTRLTDGAGTRYDQVLAIFNHFSLRNGFRYSLETGPESTGVAIVDFLKNKVGFCVQYATAMAWMVRTAGIPARVAFGFTRGSNIHQNTYTLTNRNLHAWTEVYFQDFGWVPFDATPTASIVGGVDPGWAPNPDAPDRDTPDTPIADPAGETPGDSAPALPGDDPELGEDGAAGAGVPASAGPRGRWRALGGAVLLVALLAVPALSRARVRQRRLAPRWAATARYRTRAAWDELLDTMVDFRVPLDPTETPRSTAQRLVMTARLAGPASDGARLLGHAEERARYAREPLRPDGLDDGIRAVRRELAAHAPRGTRLRAVLMPPSVLARWWAALMESMARVTDMLGQLSEVPAHVSLRRLLHRLLRRLRPSA